MIFITESVFVRQFEYFVPLKVIFIRFLIKHKFSAFRIII